MLSALLTNYVFRIAGTVADIQTPVTSAPTASRRPMQETDVVLRNGTDY